MTSYIRDIIEEAMDGGCYYCDLITLMLDDISCCEHCPFDVVNLDQCVLTTMEDMLK